MNKMNTWASSITVNLANALVFFFQCLKKDVSAFHVPSAHLSVEQRWTGAQQGSTLPSPGAAAAAGELHGSGLPLKGTALPLLPHKQAGCGSSILLSLPLGTEASPWLG